jgi:hypothetical protein
MPRFRCRQVMGLSDQTLPLRRALTLAWLVDATFHSIYQVVAIAAAC